MSPCTLCIGCTILKHPAWASAVSAYVATTRQQQAPAKVPPTAYRLGRPPVGEAAGDATQCELPAPSLPHRNGTRQQTTIVSEWYS
eukprot:7806982-Pyramimonas_sp.AAC.1